MNDTPRDCSSAADLDALLRVPLSPRPACCSARPSATTSTAGSPSGWRRRARRRSPHYFAQPARRSGAKLEALINSLHGQRDLFLSRGAPAALPQPRRCCRRSSRDKRPGDRVRIWSVPCSTGEEPYSIAIWLLENWPLVDAYNIEIVGSDIDTRGARGTREIGEYGERALSRLPAAVRDAYFEQLDDEELRGSSRICANPCVSCGQPRRPAAGAARRPLRRRLLPQRADLFRRCGAQTAPSTTSTTPCSPAASSASATRNRWARIDDRFHVRRFEDAIVYQRPRETDWTNC